MRLSKQPRTVTSDDEDNGGSHHLHWATGKNGSIINVRRNTSVSCNLNRGEDRVITHVPDEDASSASDADAPPQQSRLTQSPAQASAYSTADDLVQEAPHQPPRQQSNA